MTLAQKNFNPAHHLKKLPTPDTETFKDQPINKKKFNSINWYPIRIQNGDISNSCHQILKLHNLHRIHWIISIIINDHAASSKHDKTNWSDTFIISNYIREEHRPLNIGTKIRTCRKITPFSDPECVKMVFSEAGTIATSI